MMCLAVSTEYRRVMTDGRTSCHGIVRAMHTRDARRNDLTNHTQNDQE